MVSTTEWTRKAGTSWESILQKGIVTWYKWLWTVDGKKGSNECYYNVIMFSFFLLPVASPSIVSCKGVYDWTSNVTGIAICGMAHGILMAMLARLKIKLKSRLMLWIYTKLASDLSGEFTSGHLVVAWLPWWRAHRRRVFLVAEWLYTPVISSYLSLGMICRGSSHGFG